MSKLSRILTAVLVAILVVYAGVVTLTVPRLPPGRFGNGTSYDILSPQSFEFVEHVDAVARIRVGNWLGEIPTYYSHFDAKTLEVYAGELPRRFTLQHNNSSMYVHKSTPLPTYGTELLVFLDKQNNGSYAPSSWGFTTFYIGYDDSGIAYAIPLEANQTGMNEYFNNYASHLTESGNTVHEEVLENLTEDDPEMWQNRWIGTIYLLDQLVERTSEVLVEKDKPVLPPERLQNVFFVGGGSRTEPLDLEAVARESDAIAHVRIGDWLGDEPEFDNTCFEAFPLEVYKGELPERFFIVQSGDVDRRPEPWYTYGNELFLFLTEAEDNEYGSYRYEHTYYSTDGNHTAAIVAYDAEGTRYAVPRYYSQYNMYGNSNLPMEGLAVRRGLYPYLVENDPLIWEDRDVGYTFSLDKVLEYVDAALTVSSTEPPEVLISVGGEVVPLEPREFEWSTLNGGFTTAKATHPLELSDERWSELPCLDIAAEKFEVLCGIEPSNISIQAWHESYRGADDPWDTTRVERKFINDEDGAFEIDSGYVCVVTVNWDSDPGSNMPRFKGYAEYAFRVGSSAEVDAAQITLASFDEYPTEQLSNLLAGTPRADIRERFGEPDISSEHNDLWMTDSGKFVQASYYVEDGGLRVIRSSLGLPSIPPIIVTIDGVSHPVVTGNRSWLYTVEGKRGSGLMGCHADLQSRDWSADTIYTYVREAVITLGLSERIAERLTVEIDGDEITAESAGEAFPLYYGGWTYTFTVFISEKCEEGEEPLFSGSVDCAFRVVSELG